MNSGLPPLTDEEKAILFQTRKEAIFKRVIPLLAVTNGFLYVRGRQTGSLQKATIGAKIGLFGTASIVSFFVGIASYGSEFKRRLNELEYSPLRDAMNRRAGIVHPTDRYPPAPMGPRLQQPPQFNAPNFVHSDQSSHSHRYDNQLPIQTDSYNPKYNDFSNYENSGGVSFGNQRRSDGTFSHHDRFENDMTSVPDQNNSNNSARIPENQRYMSYKDRRQFYRNNPDAKGVIDPFENVPNRYQKPPADTQPIPSAPSKDSPMSERPFIPFFNEDSSNRKDTDSSGKFF